MIERLNLVRVELTRMVNAIVLILWRYFKYLRYRMHFSSEQGLSTEFSQDHMSEASQWFVIWR